MEWQKIMVECTGYQKYLTIVAKRWMINIIQIHIRKKKKNKYDRSSYDSSPSFEFSQNNLMYT